MKESFFNFLHSPDFVIYFALYLTAVIGALVAAMLVLIFFRRLRLESQKNREKLFSEKWRQLFFASLVDQNTEFPQVDKADYLSLIFLWQHLYDSIKGDMQSDLVLAGKKAGLEQICLQLLQSRDSFNKILAASLLGKLKSTEAAGVLESMSGEKNTFQSLSAAGSLLQIEPEKYISFFLQTFSQRPDWPLARVSHILKNLGYSGKCQALSRQCEQSFSENNWNKLLLFLKLQKITPCLADSQLLQKILAGPATGQLLAFALSLTDSPVFHQQVCSFLTHSAAGVRLEAYAALGRIARADDLSLLLAGLSDEDFFTRKQAGRSLFSQPFVSPETLAGLEEQLPDDKAREIFSQLKKEKELSS